MNGYKMQITYLLVIFAIVVQHTVVAKFPGFIKRCKLSDPKFEDCVLASAKDSLSSFLRGNAKYGLKPMPLFSNETTTYTISENFHFKLINETTNSYQNLQISFIHFDFEKKLLNFGLTGPHIEAFGRYEAAGEILGKPVHESGTANITVEIVAYNTSVTLDFVMRNDKKYLQAVSCTMVADFSNFHFASYDQVTVGEPMTAEQKKVYQSYIDKLPEAIERDEERHGKELAKTLNVIFDLEPFDEIFIP